MGKFISKIVFMPPPYYSQPDDEYKFLNTSHNSKIQFRFINRNAKFNILISHGNAEDIISVSDWAANKFSKYVDVNIILYGTLLYIWNIFHIHILNEIFKNYRIYWIWRK